MRTLRFCGVSFSLLLLVSVAFAQIQNGQFTGTVTDPSGATIANAKVTITNPSTNFTVTATTNQNGFYFAKELPIGTYRLTSEASGFKTAENTGVTLNAGTTEHVDFKMQIGQAKEIVEVTGEARGVDTEEAKLSTTVGAAQIANLPLNGRNVYDLIQLAPGAVNVNGVDFENGHGTVVNGLREDFNGFLINGVANKGLSGGVNNTPIQDTVAEFQQLQLNVSAEYGSSAGSINNLVTKSGSNALHGSVWEYLRNDKFDANQFFLLGGRAPDPRKDPTGTLCATHSSDCFKPPVRFNQFGGTIGGPIIKDKLFFFGSYQGDRFISSATPQTITVESPEWRSAIASALPNSTAALLYKNFGPSITGNSISTLDQYITGGLEPNGFSYGDYLCPDYVGVPLATKFQFLLGVTAADQAAMATPLASTGAPCSVTVAQQPGAISRNIPFLNQSTAIFGTQTQTLGNLFNGNEASARLDFTPSSSNRVYLQFNWLKSTDSFGPCTPACARGFTNATKNYYPNGQFSFVHTFSPTLLNEFRAGYTQNNQAIGTSLPGVPSIYFDDGTAGFGSYSGYPQFFKEHDYSYSDLVSISHGNHNMKAGVDVKRNLENSVFNVARPSYEMYDPIFFAADAPAEQVAGVDPGFVGNNPAQLASNFRHWRNLEFGAFFQDDWKVSKRLTLSLGLRYDLFTRHNEENNLATTFVLGPGNGLAQQVANANVPVGATLPDGSICNPANPNTVILAGVCGPGGFAAAKTLGKGDHNDFGPRVGFAWDVFGDGKTSLRGGFGVSYESTLYNPLSNSRWNPPYYSFNLAAGDLNIGGPGLGETLIYGPTTCTATSCSPSGAAPTFTGPPTNPGQGVGAQAVGNLTGWASFNPDTAYLTGIVFPKGIRDPYVYNDFLSLQREIAPKLVLEVDYVGTIGHKLFRAEDINRQAGSLLPAGATIVDNLGRTLTGLGGRPNPNYGRLRNWQNAVNSNYHALQVSAKKQMSHGLLFNASYTYSHSIDEGSTWHSGSTTASGGAAGDGFTTDQALPGLDRGNSVFDIRHRFALNYVYELPGQKLHGFLGAVAGGWQLNGIWALQSGAHWSPFNSRSARLSSGCSVVPFVAANCVNKGGDYNLDGGRNDRPNSSIPQFSQSRSTWANGWCLGGGSILNGACLTPNQANLPALTNPCLGCTGTLGRNQFEGPGQWVTDMGLSKVFNLTERANLKFEWSAFNVFNRANFLLAVDGSTAAHNKLSDLSFGQARGTLNARNMQFGLKLSF